MEIVDPSLTRANDSTQEGLLMVPLTMISMVETPPKSTSPPRVFSAKRTFLFFLAPLSQQQACSAWLRNALPEMR